MSTAQQLQMAAEHKMGGVKLDPCAVVTIGFVFADGKTDSDQAVILRDTGRGVLSDSDCISIFISPKIAHHASYWLQ